MKLVPVSMVRGEGVWGTQCPGPPKASWGSLHTTKAHPCAYQSLPARILSPALPTPLPVFRDWPLGFGGRSLAAGGYETLRVVHPVPSRAQHPTDSPASGARSAGHNKLCDLHIDEFNIDSGFQSVKILEGFRKSEGLKCAERDIEGP